MESKIQEFFETEDMMNNEDYEEEAPEEGEVADEASES